MYSVGTAVNYQLQIATTSATSATSNNIKEIIRESTKKIGN